MRKKTAKQCGDQRCLSFQSVPGVVADAKHAQPIRENLVHFRDPVYSFLIRCKNGHERKVRIDEIEQLDFWLGSEIEVRDQALPPHE